MPAVVLAAREGSVPCPRSPLMPVPVGSKPHHSHSLGRRSAIAFLSPQRSSSRSGFQQLWHETPQPRPHGVPLSPHHSGETVFGFSHGEDKLGASQEPVSRKRQSRAIACEHRSRQRCLSRGPSCSCLSPPAELSRSHLWRRISHIF